MEKSSIHVWVKKILDINLFVYVPYVGFTLTSLATPSPFLALGYDTAYIASPVLVVACFRWLFSLK